MNILNIINLIKTGKLDEATRQLEYELLKEDTPASKINKLKLIDKYLKNAKKQKDYLGQPLKYKDFAPFIMDGYTAYTFNDNMLLATPTETTLKIPEMMDTPTADMIDNDDKTDYTKYCKWCKARGVKPYIYRYNKFMDAELMATTLKMLGTIDKYTDTRETLPTTFEGRDGRALVMPLRLPADMAEQVKEQTEEYDKLCLTTL